MDELVVPPSLKWFKSSAAACAPDNTLVYFTKRAIVVIDKGNLTVENYSMIFVSDQKKILSISLNAKWGDPSKYCVVLTEDNVLTLWDLSTFEKKITNTDNTAQDQFVASVFAGDDRVVSSTLHGAVNIWNIHTNESKSIKNLFSTSKVNVTCLSSCPHAYYLIAFGLTNGCVCICDLRRNGKILFRLKGHTDEVTGFSWCPAPVNIFPKVIRNTVRNKLKECDFAVLNEPKIVVESANDCSIVDSNQVASSGGDFEHVSKSENLDQVKSEQVAPSVVETGHIALVQSEHAESSVAGSEQTIVKSKQGVRVGSVKGNLWTNLRHADDDEVTSEQKPETAATEEPYDFLPECLRVKKIIFGYDKNAEQFEVNASKDEFSEDKDLDTEKEALDWKQVDNDKVLEIDLMGENGSGDAPRIDVPQLPETGIELAREAEEQLKALQDTIKEGVTLTVRQEGVEQANEAKETNAETLKPRAIISASTRKGEPGIEEDPRPEFLLASIGRDGAVYIWRASTDGVMQTFFTTPKQVQKRGSRSSKQLWYALCWITPETILTTTRCGDILAWTLPKPKDGGKLYRTIKNENTNIIFHLLTPSRLYTEYNFKVIDESLTFWSFGINGKLILTDLNSGRNEVECGVITALVQCMAASPLDPNRLVLAQKDNYMRMLDLSVASQSLVRLPKINVNAKVMCVAWHPSKEAVLAYGTEDGRIGICEVNSSKCTLLRHYFNKPVYHVEWGPLHGDLHDLGIYAVSDGKAVIYDTSAFNNEVIKLNIMGKMFVYKFSWKPDFSCLLLNIIDGSVIVLNADLSLKKTLYFNDKSLNMSVWHPDGVGLVEGSKRTNWFAATIASGFLVYDLQLDAVEDDNHMNNIIGKFEGHLKQPTCLAWNPWHGNQIVSTSSDGLTHIWDTNTMSALATICDDSFNYSSQVMWSPLDPDLIILAERIIKIVRISRHKSKCIKSLLEERKVLLEKLKKEDVSIKSKTRIDISVGNKITISKNVIVPSIYASSDCNFDLQIEKMRELMEYNEEKSDTIDPFHLFLNKDKVLQLLTMHYNGNKKNNKFKSCELIALWKGNIGEYIKDAINENRVTPMIITLAPMVSPKLWLEACEVYAKMLSENADSDPLETASYYLACHKIEEAINCLIVNKQFREALALAKCRLLEDSSIIEDITQQWAMYCVDIGNFELAAYCFIAIKQYDKAAKFLSRRNNTEFLTFSLELAKKADNKELCNYIQYKIDGQEVGEKKQEEIVETKAVVELLTRTELFLNNDSKLQQFNKETCTNDYGEKDEASAHI